MKQIYILAMAALLCAGTANADGKRIQAKRISKRMPSVTAIAKSMSKEGPRRGQRFAAPGAIMKPGTQTDYFYEPGEDGAEGEWVEAGKINFTYDNEGKVLLDEFDFDGMIERTAYTYDANGQRTEVLVTSSEDGVEFVNSSKTLYNYDNVVVDFVTSRLGYDHDGNDWVENHLCEFNNIERNDDGKIITITKVLPMAGAYIPGYKAEWTYDDATGMATTFGYYENYTENVEWQLSESTLYTEIEWDRTNGQMTGDELQDCVSGPNRFKKAKVLFDGEFDGYSIMEYSDIYPDDYLLKETTTDPEEILTTVSYHRADDGSVTEQYLEYVDEDGQPTQEPVYGESHVTTCDEHGNVTSEALTMLENGEWMKMEGINYEYVYDADGNVQEVTTYVYDMDADDYTPDMRSVFSDYTDCSGINEVAADNTKWNISNDAVSAQGGNVKGISLYSLQGIKLLNTGADAVLSTATLQPGIYLVHAEGTNATIRYIKR